jgi:hypothetical protein
MNFQRIGFASQLEDDEIVERSFRRPFAPIFSRIMMWLFVFSFLGWCVWTFLPRILPFGNQSHWLVLLVVIFGIERLVRVFWKWYGNAVLMTNESLVFAEWEGFFDRRTVRLDYWDLDEVGLERKGVASFFAGIGDLVFEKTTGGDPYIFRGVNNPKRAVKILRHHRGRMLDEKNFTEESALRNLLSQMVQTHVRKNGQPLREQTGFENNEKEEISKEEISIDGEELMEVDFELDDDGGIEIELKD